MPLSKSNNVARSTNINVAFPDYLKRRIAFHHHMMLEGRISNSNRHQDAMNLLINVRAQFYTMAGIVPPESDKADRISRTKAAIQVLNDHLSA